MNKDRRDTRKREQEYIKEYSRNNGWVMFAVTLLLLIVFAVLFTLAATRVIDFSEEPVMYKAEVIQGTCSELNIDKSEIQDVYLIGEDLYAVRTKDNVYLVGIKIENGVVKYVDVEKALLE